MILIHIKIRNNLLPHPIIYLFIIISSEKCDFSLSFWGKAMDFTGEMGNRFRFSF